MTAYSSGGAGDIVFQIKIMKMLDVKTLYVLDAHYNEHTTIASTVGRLLKSQGIDSFPILNPDVMKFDYNLDEFRNVLQHGHLIKRMLSQFKLPYDNWNTPWIENIKPITAVDNLINVTIRYREGSNVDWKKILWDKRDYMLFIGFRDEWEKFCEDVFWIPYLPTINLFEMAQYISGCDALYCNQSAALAIAQGLGKKYFLEHKPEKFNCLMYTKNENILS